jgi:hypothetical protein
MIRTCVHHQETAAACRLAIAAPCCRRFRTSVYESGCSPCTQSRTREHTQKATTRFLHRRWRTPRWGSVPVRRASAGILESFVPGPSLSPPPTQACPSGGCSFARTDRNASHRDPTGGNDNVVPYLAAHHWIRSFTMNLFNSPWLRVSSLSHPSRPIRRARIAHVACAAHVAASPVAPSCTNAHEESRSARLCLVEVPERR